MNLEDLGTWAPVRKGKRDSDFKVSLGLGPPGALGGPCQWWLQVHGGCRSGARNCHLDSCQLIISYVGHTISFNTNIFVRNSMSDSERMMAYWLVHVWFKVPSHFTLYWGFNKLVCVYNIKVCLVLIHRLASQLHLGRLKLQPMLVTRKGCYRKGSYHKTPTYWFHILKRINIQAFVSNPVERSYLKMVVYQCLSKYLSCISRNWCPKIYCIHLNFKFFKF